MDNGQNRVITNSLINTGRWLVKAASQNMAVLATTLVIAGIATVVMATLGQKSNPLFKAVEAKVVKKPVERKVAEKLIKLKVKKRVKSKVIKPRTVRSLIKSWAGKFKEFDSKTEETHGLTVKHDIKELKATLKEYNEKFYKKPPKGGIGCIDRCELPAGGKILTKGDLHGDLDSLIQQLKAWQKEGYLDKDFKVTKKWEGKVKFVFLGDYIDRGRDSFKLVQLLMKFKLNNPHSVVLNRGNHDDVDYSKDLFYQKENGKRGYWQGYIHSSEKGYYADTELCEMLRKCFNTMPLGTFIACDDNQKEREYVLFAHGLFDLDTDFAPFLDGQETRMWLFKNKPYKLSDRVKKLVPSSWAIISLEKYLKNRSNKILQYLVRWSLNISNESSLDYLYKKAQEAVAAYRLNQFFHRREENILKLMKSRRRGSSTHLWGDVGKSTKYIDQRGLQLSPADCQMVMHANSSIKNRIVAIVKAHQHYYEVYGDGLIHVLPAAGELRYYKDYHNNIDRSYILTVKPKVSLWTRELYSRKQGDNNYIIRKHNYFKKRIAMW